METNIYDLIQNHSTGKGEGIMWDSVKLISDSIETSMPKEEADCLKRKLYEMMEGKHFDENMAKEAVSKMYYSDENGEKKYAPYWTVNTIQEIFTKVSPKISQYNMWDFFVTIHLVASNNHALIVKWFPNDTPEQRDERYVEMSVNWLNDPNSPISDHKIWGYIFAEV